MRAQPRRSKARAYLLLSRVSNLPTVWTNVLAGTIAARAAVDAAAFTAIATGVSLMYVGGMFLNDGFDAAFDARHRPDRPIPNGDVARGEALTVGAGLLLAGTAIASSSLSQAAWAGALALAILLYDVTHKWTRAAVLAMGACRGLIYLIAGAGAPLAAALVLTIYVIGITGVARLVGQRAGLLMPILVAGISIVDAAVILASGGTVALAVGASLGFALTLLLQRVVPGT